MRAYPIVLLAVVFLVGACEDGAAPSTDGTLVVSTSTGGSQPDQDGYQVSVDSARLVSVPPTGTVNISLPAGRHALRLLGVAAQCSVTSDAVLEVRVPSRGTVPVAFDVNCPATAARIAVTTTGVDIDFNGYEVLVDGAERAHVQPNDTVLTPLEPGSRTIGLTDLRENCTTDGPASRTVTVVDPEVVSLEFAVACTAVSGVVGILIHASGPAVYELFEASLDGSPFPGGRLVPGVLQYMVTGVPAGDHVISLSDSPPCSVETGPQPASLTVGALVRDTVELTFSVTCSLPEEDLGTLRISAPTTGSTPPSTRYTVLYASWGPYWYGSDWAVLGTLEPNGTLVTEAAARGIVTPEAYWYDFDLADVPANCSVRSPSPPPGLPNTVTGFTVTAGDTLDLVFAVTCPP